MLHAIVLPRPPDMKTPVYVCIPQSVRQLLQEGQGRQLTRTWQCTCFFDLYALPPPPPCSQYSHKEEGTSCFCCVCHQERSWEVGGIEKVPHPLLQAAASSMPEYEGSLQWRHS